MATKILKFPRTLSVFTLAMINVAAVGSVKSWPFIAEYGFAALFYLILTAVFFFFPVSLVSAELATGWPKKGGVFTWVKEAFGPKWGFLAIWLLWIENFAWYPTILAFIASAVAYIIDPALAEHKLYTLSFVLVSFWACTFANLFGMRTSGWISTIGAIFGTILPGLLIVTLGLIWYFSGHPLQISFDAASFLPNFSLDQMVFFTGILLAFCGMEMSSVHALDVRHPQKDYPRAIFLSALIIFSLTLLGVLSIAMVVPKSDISLVAGALQAITVFIEKYGIGWMVPYIAGLIAIGSVGAVSTWIIGPCKGVLAAAEEGDLPPIFKKTNANGVPVSLILTQGIVVSVLCLMFLLMPTVSSTFWIFTVLAAQLYLIMYILMFAAAIKLRYSKPDVPRPYKIRGGHLGMWLVAGFGIIGSAFALIIGYFPPSQIATGSRTFYMSFLILGTAIGCLLPIFIIRRSRRH
ncbi:MAG TPA: amino acid permease [Rhabdochlamydiaceae bacterium]|nr:amino acid permease [Rhabdochlamydiaceae bacterium]